MTSNRNLVELFCDWDDIEDDAELEVSDVLKLMQEAREDEKAQRTKEFVEMIDKFDFAQYSDMGMASGNERILKEELKKKLEKKDAKETI
ncbi:hypothetical protein M0R04_14690 [Candidatus Dojkabacteria bacterium]|jgi:hypothetical protein|nr:hypothetical protein [Candidatus Dojkabacteria bacterium]